MDGYEIVHQVHAKYRGIAQRLAGITSKCSEWFSSHGRESKTHNPMQSGNLSPVDHFMTYCRQHEACGKGAGLMMAELTYAELLAEFSDGGEVCIAEMHREGSEALQAVMDKAPAMVTKQELRENIACNARVLQHYRTGEPQIRTAMRQVVESRTNGRAN